MCHIQTFHGKFPLSILVNIQQLLQNKKKKLFSYKTALNQFTRVQHKFKRMMHYIAATLCYRDAWTNLRENNFSHTHRESLLVPNNSIQLR